MYYVYSYLVGTTKLKGKSLPGLQTISIGPKLRQDWSYRFTKLDRLPYRY